MLDEVDFVTATVMEFDKPRRHLQLGDLSNLNPDKQMTLESNPIVGGDYEGTEYPDDYYEAIFSDFDYALVVGDSGAQWITRGSRSAPEPFDDSAEIQTEFDQIKILDLSDQNPFGFY